MIVTGFGFTAGSQSLLRGDNQQSLTLPDLWGCMIGQDEEKQRPGYLQVNCVCWKGKTLAVGTTQHASFRRHKNPLKCAVAHLAFLLFWRFEGPEAEAPVDFQYRNMWYDKAVMPQFQNRNAGISDSTYTELIKKAYTLAGLDEFKISMAAKRHIMRKFGSQNMQAGGVLREGVRAQGGWQGNGVSDFSYLQQVDETAMHVGACTHPHPAPSACS